MPKKESFPLVGYAIIAIVAFGILGAIDISGGFSTTSTAGDTSMLVPNDGNDEGFSNTQYDPTQDGENGDIWNPLRDGCRIIGVDSISTAADELGAEAYFELTRTSSLTEINGVVYACG